MTGSGCGVLRGLCGVLKLETPQRNVKPDSRLRCLRGFAGFHLYTYACVRARPHIREGVTANRTPHLPAKGTNFPHYKDLACGVWGHGNPVGSPQTAGFGSEVWGWAS